jgi:hypothetical protein
MLANGAINAGYIVEMVIGALFGMRLFNSSLIVDMVVSGLPTAIWLLMAWYCWYRAPSLANRVVGSTENNLSSLSVNPEDLLQIALIALGVYFLGEAIPGLAGFLYDALPGVSQGVFGTPRRPDVVVSMTRFLLGLWLILGTPGVARLIRKHSGRWRDDPLDSSQAKTPE